MSIAQFLIVGDDRHSDGHGYIHETTQLLLLITCATKFNVQTDIIFLAYYINYNYVILMYNATTNHRNPPGGHTRHWSIWLLLHGRLSCGADVLWL